MEICISIAAKTSEYAVGPITNQISYIFKHEGKVESLKIGVEKLKDARERVRHLIEEAKRRGEEIEQDVEKWLTQVNKKLSDQDQEEDADKAKNKCLIGLCPNLKTRYQLSKRAEKESESIVELLNEAEKFNSVSVSYRPAPQEITSTYVKGFEDFESRRHVFDGVMEALKDSSVNVVGLYGLGGVGKTTLARHVAGQAKEKNLFDTVVMAFVTQNAETAEIQQQIGDRLGLEFDAKTISVRADRLRERLKKENKVLVILDDLWARLDLEAVGIPCGGEHVGCKILLTSRDLNVLSMMDSRNNFPVGVLEEKEAWNLFNKIAGDSVTENPDVYSTAIDVAKKCAGLPIAIVTVARALRNKGLFQWRDALQQLRTPSSRNFTGIPAPIYSAIELSYSHLESQELKSTFLLCSLLCADTPISDLVKYGVGLGLFQGINTIEEARDRAYSLVNQLKSSCLLIDSFFEDIFSVHDVVRDVALSIAFREQHGFSLRNEVAPKDWPPMDMLNNCIFMSLSHNHFIELPEDLECPQLQFFYICNVFPTLKLRDNFFTGMRKLEVLDLTGVCFSSLPWSVSLLANVRTLCLDRSSFENIAIVGELKTIEILSLRECDIKQLPREIGQLSRLRMLDLGYNPRLKLIPSGVFSSLSGLEELCLESSFTEWDIEGNASLVELKRLSRLTSLDVHIRNVQIVPMKLFSEKLKRYQILIGDMWYWSSQRKTSRTLKLKLNSSFHLDHEIKTLLKKTEDLYLDEVEDIKNVLHELDAEGFPQLKYLHVQNSPTMEHIINSVEWVPCKAFPILESLSLRNMINFEKICHGEIVAESFSRLKIIKVAHCDRLNNFFSLSTARKIFQLQEIEVTYCKNITEIVAEEREGNIEDNEALFCQLRYLSLGCLSNFLHFCSREEKLLTSEHGRSQSTIDTRSKERTLFDEKDVFPNLEKLDLFSINVEKIWHMCCFPANCSTVQNLTTFIVSGCGNLKCLLSSSMVQSLVQLKMLEITDCKMMEEVVVAEEEKVSKMIFPKLETLLLRDLPKLTRFCSESLIEFSSLSELFLENCPCLKVLVSGFPGAGTAIKKEERKNNSKENIYTVVPTLFDEKVALPMLKRLSIYGMASLEKIWHDQLYLDSLCKLNYFSLGSCEKLLNVFPFSMLERLQGLETLVIFKCDSLEEIFESQGLCARESCAAKATQSTEIEAITKLAFPQVRSLGLTKLPKLKSFYPRLHSTEWPLLERMGVVECDKVEIFASEYPSPKEIQGKTQFEFPIQQPLFWVNKVTFPSLEELTLVRKEKVKEIWQGQVPAEYFRKLKVLVLRGLPKQSATLLCRFFRSLKSLEKLDVGDASFDKIFQCEGLAGEEKHAWTFHCLAELMLFRLPELMHLWEEGFQPGPIFQKLRTIKVMECDKLKCLAPSSASFQNLITLEVSKCHGFLNLVTHSTAKSLMQLTRMSVTDCKMIENIVACVGEETKDAIAFTQLKYLELNCLPNLECFCLESCDLVFPSLEQLIVMQCPNMKIFSKGGLSTPKLQKVQVAEDEAKGHTEGSHNTTVQQLFKEQNFKAY
ncbi:probable disease resistance protein At4g27220 isoform X2 [Herrania umbratica]|uniref:Probable disease resistance protein At4g27220 isoform X2 n=1 Tax=Herrania umbratica TaxID=108875 RepID=A0A6J1A307_9ROSI|nr:probable disease resistance protein At4g27220 isoform X2 [Herrania umbratica]